MAHCLAASSAASSAPPREALMAVQMDSVTEMTMAVTMAFYLVDLTEVYLALTRVVSKECD